MIQSSKEEPVGRGSPVGRLILNPAFLLNLDII